MHTVYVGDLERIQFSETQTGFSSLSTVLLADRTNSRACATVLRSSVVCVMICIAAKRCVLHEVIYAKSVGTKINDLDLCLEVV